MAIRVGGFPPSEAPVEEPMAAPAMPEMGGMEEITPPMDGMMGGGTVDPAAARYFDSTHSCAGCIHFMEPDACEIVAGPIDAGGICSLYTPDVEAMPMEEAPIEEELPQESPAEPEEDISDEEE